jgi:hypothetical protein
LPEQAEEVMPNFTVKDISPSRFEGEFAVETDPSHSPTASEAAYLTKLNEILTMLADDQRHDKTNPLQPLLVDARREYRKAEAAKLREIAQNFAHGSINADAALSATAEAARKYALNRPDLVAQDKASGETRFAGDFIITATNYQPDDAETAYINRIAYVLDTLSDDEVADKAAGYSVARLAARQECRKECAIGLRKEFEEFGKNDVIAAIAADNALVTQGIYIANRDRLKLPLFDVNIKTGTAGAPDADLAVELDIGLTPGLPPPDDQPSQEKQDLFVDVGNAYTVISTVSQHMHDRAAKIGKRWWYAKERRQRRENDERERARRLLDQYVRKLAGIARVGLQGPHTPLAKLALNELRAEFTAQQAGLIKNIYVRSLGAAAGVSSTSLLVLYAFIAKYVGVGWWYDHKAFLIAAAGAAIGTWLSFSIRRVNLSFSDLAILEEDLLDPSVRIVFVIGLTLTACLLFWTGVMNIQIGDLKTNATEFMQKGSIAMLVGIFFGISERALATAISGRATAFVRGIGSG